MILFRRRVQVIRYLLRDSHIVKGVKYLGMILDPNLSWKVKAKLDRAVEKCTLTFGFSRRTVAVLYSFIGW